MFAVVRMLDRLGDMMSEAARVGASGSRQKPNGNSCTQDDFLRVESRVTDIEHNHVKFGGLLEEVLKRLGKDSDGPHEATGLYGKIAAIDKRVTPFEKLSEQVKGAVKALVLLGPPTAIIMWFLGADRIVTIFHG